MITRETQNLLHKADDSHAEPIITNEQAVESYQWAEEFMQAVKDYLEA